MEGYVLWMRLLGCRGSIESLSWACSGALKRQASSEALHWAVRRALRSRLFRALKVRRDAETLVLDARTEHGCIFAVTLQAV